MFGVLAFAGGIGELINPTRPGSPVGGLALSAAITLVSAGLLVRWRWQEIQARNREIVARADAQHHAVMRGDDELGVYGRGGLPPP